MKAKVEPVDAVNLWLGANVMLEYTLEDATDLLVRPAPRPLRFSARPLMILGHQAVVISMACHQVVHAHCTLLEIEY